MLALLFHVIMEYFFVRTKAERLIMVVTRASCGGILRKIRAFWNRNYEKKGASERMKVHANGPLNT